jgi:ATP-dependent Clp protease ATP-binding subunit ClpA
VGTGDAEGSMNAANILKPALSRGELQVIGATTFNEYRKHIEKDAALERRFQPVTVEEPSVADSIGILKGVAPNYEKFHHVKISDELIESCVRLSERYITDRFLPDKAIDLLDEACSCSALANKELAEYEISGQKLRAVQAKIEALQQEETIDYEALATAKAEALQLEMEHDRLEPIALAAEVAPKDLATVIELWTGIPASKVQESDLKKLGELEATLKQHVVGQDEACKLVAAAVKRSRVQISARRRPASFIFVGPTGVGKTELVKVLANEMFQTEDPLIRLDMSEFMEKHAVSRIVGSPPGYVGYDEAGQLTEKVRRKPYSVILFDEIEKAHPDVFNIMLQLLDDGILTDSQGRRVDFRNTVIIMTSNLGAKDILNTTSTKMGFGTSNDTEADNDAIREKVMAKVKDAFRPEFLNRIDETVFFDALTLDNLSHIVDIQIKYLKDLLKERKIELIITKEAKDNLALNGYNPMYGARPLKRTIRQMIENPLSKMLLKGEFSDGDKIEIDFKDDKITFSKI